MDTRQTDGTKNHSTSFTSGADTPRYVRVRQSTYRLSRYGQHQARQERSDPVLSCTPAAYHTCSISHLHLCRRATLLLDISKRFLIYFLLSSWTGFSPQRPALSPVRPVRRGIRANERYLVYSIEYLLFSAA